MVRCLTQLGYANTSRLVVNKVWSSVQCVGIPREKICLHSSSFCSRNFATQLYKSKLNWRPNRRLHSCQIRAAQWDELKKCSHLRFGRTQRLLQPKDEHRYWVDPESIHVGKWRQRPALIAKLNASDDVRPKLQLIIMRLWNGVIRIAIEDDSELPYKRYVHHDFLSGANDYLPFSSDHINVRDDVAIINIAESPFTVHIRLSPFSLQLVQKTTGDTIISLGDNNKLNMETFTCQGQVEEFNGFRDSKLRGDESIGLDIGFPQFNYLYGIPSRTTSFRLKETVSIDGKTISDPYRMYNIDLSEYELDETIGLYGSIPFLMGRNGQNAAGVLWMNSSETYLDVFRNSNQNGMNAHLFSESGIPDVFIFPGPTISNVYQQYINITGKPCLAQRFALGYHQCRYSYVDERDVVDINEKFNQYDIPVDVIWLDIDHTNEKRYFTWDYKKYPNPDKLLHYFGNEGRQLVTITDPHIKRDPKYTVHAHATSKDLYVKNLDETTFEGECWSGNSSYVDYSNPRARDMWASQYQASNYPHYADNLYTWIDMNEPSVFDGPERTMPKDLLHIDNVEHRHIHNAYGHLMAQATYNGVKNGHGGDDRPFILTRSFFVGTQKYAAVWTGDNTATWEHLRSSVPMLLSLQISGISLSGADVGGFFGNPTPELLTRWYQSAAFQPFFRGHSNENTNRREPWLFGEPYTSIIANAIRTRYQYIPYWYTLFAANSLNSNLGFHKSIQGPPMRPLWWEFPNDPNVDSIEDEWMVGNALLVAPVMKEGATSHEIYVPGGNGERWYDLYSEEGEGTEMKRTGKISMKVELGRKVVLQRGGTIVVKQERRRRSTKAMEGDPYTIVIGMDKEGKAEGEVYMDDGKSYGYEKGEYVLRRFKYGGGELRAETVSGGNKHFAGITAEIERVVILGHPNSPSKVLVDGKEANFAYAKDTKVLTIQRVMISCGSGNWVVSIK